MERLAIRQCHDAQHSPAQFWYHSPKSNASIGLIGSSQRVGYYPLTPVYLNIRPLALDLFLKVPRRLHLIPVASLRRVVPTSRILRQLG